MLASKLVSDEDRVQVHVLKCLVRFFEEIECGNKTFECRVNDRDFRVGDILELREWAESRYTGRKLRRRVTYIMHGLPYMRPGHCVMALSRDNV